MGVWLVFQNVCFIFPQFLYQFFCGFSQQVSAEAAVGAPLRPSPPRVWLRWGVDGGAGGVKLEGGDQSCRPALGSCGCGFAVLGGAAATLTPGPPDVITSWSLCVWKKALCVRWRTRRPLGLWAAAGENAHVLGQVIPKAYLPRARAALPRLVSRRPCTTLPT